MRDPVDVVAAMDAAMGHPHGRDERHEESPAAMHGDGASVLGAPGSGLATQGSFVTCFDLPQRDVRRAVHNAQALLPRLIAECAHTEDTAASAWRRCGNNRRDARVKLWERGCLSMLTGARGVAAQKTSQVQDLHSIGKSMDSKAGDGALQYAVRSSVTVKASLATIWKTLDCAVTTAYRSYMKALYETLVADTSVLAHSAIAPQLSETLAVRWLVTRCQNAMVSDCDFCLAEYSKLHSPDELAVMGGHRNNNAPAELEAAMRGHDGLRDKHVLPAAYKLFYSTETKHCPVLQDSHQLIRAQVPLGGFLFYETDNADVTDVVYFMSLSYDCKADERNGRGYLSNEERQFRALQQVLQRMALSVNRIINAVSSYELSMQLEAVRETPWINDSDRTECVVCYRRFNAITRRRHHCRMCGEVICRDCSVHKDFDLPDVGPMALRICKVCEVERFTQARGAGARISGRPPRQRTRSLASVMISRARRHKDQEVSQPEETHRHVSNQSPLPISRPSARRQSAAPAASCPKPNSQEVPSFDQRWKQDAKTPHIVVPASPLRGDNRAKQLLANKSSMKSGARTPSPLHNIMLTSESTAERQQKEVPPRAPIAHSSRRPHHAQMDNDFFNTAPAQLPSFSIQRTEEEKKKPKAKESHESKHLRLGHIQVYEDLVERLCDQAMGSTHAKYAAVSIITADPIPSQPINFAHYLKAQGSRKIVKISPNMQCCDPVLGQMTPVATRNALQANINGINMADLPFVKGPQRARFYAGIPLADSKQRAFGALAVFDERFSGTDTQFRECIRALEASARSIVMKMEQRQADAVLKAFMKSPLVRQSEPTVTDVDADAEPSPRCPEQQISEEDIRMRPRFSSVPMQRTKFSSGANPYTQQMQRLVRQAQQTHEQVLQNDWGVHVQDVNG